MSKDSRRLAALAERMRADWDRRIVHDYRFWMSDGVESDHQMWIAGERDFALLFQGYDPQLARRQQALEIGCGVGRLLRAASQFFGRVVGIDVSGEAIQRAHALLHDRPNVQILQGNGFNLEPLPATTFGAVYTFAALGSMPAIVVAEYLLEAARVLIPNGELRLQIYLGSDQDIFQEDTLGIRGFRPENFVRGALIAGFVVDAVKELILPFPVSDPDVGLVAHLVALRRTGDRIGSREAVFAALVPQGERWAGDQWSGSSTEYLMAVSRADQHLNAGRILEAQRALEFAVKHYGEAEASVKQILEELGKRTAPASSSVPPSQEILARNLRVLQDRFSCAAVRIPTSSPEVSSITGASGQPVLTYRGMPLDQVDKPLHSAERWVEQTLKNGAHLRDLVVVGIASGYHLETLRRCTNARIHLVEPNLSILRGALSLRPLEEVFLSLASVSTSLEEFRSTVMADVALDEMQLLVQPQTLAVERDVVDSLRAELCGKRGFAELRPTIAVVGPIYGGTLPLARYAIDALRSLRQRVSAFELGAFHGAYRELRHFVRDPARQGALESYYVELLSQIVLESVTEKPIDILIALAQAPLSPRVLTELRHRGTITALWFMEDCRRFKSWREIARYYDYVFLIQRGEFPGLVSQAGAGSVHYLPVGCDPKVHQPLNLTDEERYLWGSDLSFVGAGYNNRVQMFAGLARRNFKIWGTEWPSAKPFDRLVQERGRRLAPDEYVKIFNATPINLNLHSSAERDGVEPFGDFVNPRTFELAASGAFQLVDERSLLGELFKVGDEIITFRDRKDLDERIDHYLANPAERQRVAARARFRALRDHTYEKRLRQLLEHIYADRFDELRERQQGNAWTETLRAAERHPELRGRLEAAYERGFEPQLDSLVAEIRTGKGSLTKAEQKLLFLHHVMGQVDYVTHLRQSTEK